MKLTGSGYPPLNTEGVPLHNFPVPSLMKTADPARMYVLGDPRYVGVFIFIVIRLTGGDYLPHKTEGVTLFSVSLLLKNLPAELRIRTIFDRIRLFQTSIFGSGSESGPESGPHLNKFSVPVPLHSFPDPCLLRC
jgi:hypothetical protein